MGLIYNKGSALHGSRHRPLECQSKGPKYMEANQMDTSKCAQTVPMKRLYSIKEIVKLIGATEWFWRSQIWDGRLPYVQVGRKMLIDYRDIEKFIQQNRIQN